MAKITVSVEGSTATREYDGESWLVSGEWITVLDGKGRALHSAKLPADAVRIERTDDPPVDLASQVQ